MYCSTILLFLLYIPPSSQTNERKLLEHLLKYHSVFARPVLNASNPVVVTFGFELIHIVSLAEDDQTITVKLWLRISWFNEYMTWDPKRFGNVKTSKLKSEFIWTPDIYIQEDIGEEMSSGPEKYRTPITIQSNGKQTWLVPVLIEGSCVINVNNFPFDRQECLLKFTSWAHDQSEIVIQGDPRPVVTENYINSTAWTLSFVDSLVESVLFECCPIPYSNIKFTIIIDRKPHYYIYYVIVPCIIQMVVILFSFFLPPDCGERIGIVITVLLVFAVYLEIVSDSLPKTSGSTPTLSHFYITSMVETVAAFIATCLVMAIHFKGTEKGIPPMPQRIRNIFIDTIAKFVFVRKNLREYTNASLLALQEIGTPKETEYKQSDPQPEVKGVALQKALKYIQERKENMEPLITEVRVITKLIHDLNRQDEIEEEWQIFGKVLDRLFFVLFSITFVVSSFVIILPVYFSHHN